MGRYRKKPVVIEAVQWTGSNIDEVLAFDMRPELDHTENGDPVLLAIPTAEGTMIATPGDWIIRGVKGEVYPCKPDIFEATYEEVGSLDLPV